MRNTIYLDYNATTPVAPEVADAIAPYLHEGFGHPCSAHPVGRHAHEAVATARRCVADLIGAAPRELWFTSGATEANNLGLLGTARALGAIKRHVVVSAIEHASVMAPARALAEQGWEVTVVPVDEYGRVSPDAVAGALRADTAWVSVMHANNEVGTVQPLADIAAVTRRHGVLLHTDASQSVGKLPVDVNTLGVDLLTVSGHKFYATKGVGALYVRRGTPISPMLFGAGETGDLRPGTENVPAIVGIGMAATLAGAGLAAARRHLAEMRDLLHERLEEGVPGLALNGHAQQRLPNTLHVSFPDANGRELLRSVEHRVAAGVGSACMSHLKTSSVLAAMGIGEARAAGAVRLSVGVMTTRHEVTQAARILVDAWVLARQAGVR